MTKVPGRTRRSFIPTVFVISFANLMPGEESLRHTVFRIPGPAAKVDGRATSSDAYTTVSLSPLNSIAPK